MTDPRAANKTLNDQERLAEAVVCRSKPVIIWLESTSRCNLKCITCPTKTYTSDRGHDLEEEVFEKVRREVFPTLSTVQLQGDGEPTLSKRFHAIFDAAASEGIEIFSISNATIWTDALIEKLVHARAHLWISVDGFSKEVFEGVRYGAKRDKVFGNIEKMARRRAETPGSPLKFGFVWVAIRDNVHELPEFIRQAAAWGAEDLCVNDFNLGGIPDFVHEKALKNDPAHANKWLREARRTAEELGFKVTLPALFPEPGFGRSDVNGILKEEMKDHSVTNASLEPIADAPFPNPESRIPNPGAAFHRSPGKRYPQKCSSPWDTAFIDAEGHVKPCCYYPDYMGDLTTQTFEEIWNGSAYRRLRRRIHSAHPPYYCKRCTGWWGINAGNPDAVMSQFTWFERLVTKVQRYWPNVRKFKKLRHKLFGKPAMPPPSPLYKR